MPVLKLCRSPATSPGIRDIDVALMRPGYSAGVCDASGKTLGIGLREAASAEAVQRSTRPKKRTALRTPSEHAAHGGEEHSLRGTASAEAVQRRHYEVDSDEHRKDREPEADVRREGRSARSPGVLNIVILIIA